MNSGIPARQKENVLRCRWRIVGRVQGVGFRPFVSRLARRMHIGGGVWNDAQGVIIEGQGTRDQLDEFIRKLRAGAPAASAIRQMIEERIPRRDEDAAFEILRTTDGAAVIATAEIAADLAICPDCLAEIRDPADLRRHQYALTNCTNCGPRFSILRAIPYDRCNTAMASFVMCQPCRAEYDRPSDRRFHAQPIACSDCGPRLHLLDSHGTPIVEDSIVGAAQRLAEGKIVAVKGIGGFHLAVRANDPAAVARLRTLKHRPAKPFALMAASLETAGRLVRLSTRGAELIASRAAPVVLAPRAAEARVAPDVAPGQHRLGVMLAYTPLHHLLFDRLIPLGVDILVMTSGNDVDEPLAFEDGDAAARLGAMCDAILTHERQIERAVDDSVVIDAASGPIFMRRARGYVPEPISLPAACDSGTGLAVGAELKSTIAVCRDGQAILSQHLGDLKCARTFEAFKGAVSDLCGLLCLNPRWIAHDLHPAYLSTQYATQLAGLWGVPIMGVQHHHAHAAAVLAEHGETGTVLAVVCDGTGYGADGTIWGGELLVASLVDFHRIGRIAPMLLPGGDACARQPWRSAIALLHAAFGRGFIELPIVRRTAKPRELEFIQQMLEGGVSCVQSSSTGRLFDGVAALLGLCAENRFDAEAPMTLEAAAALSERSAQTLDKGYRLQEVGGLIEIDLTPVVRIIGERAGHEESSGDLAMLFHQTLAAAWSAAVASAMQKTRLRTVALTGGVFCNELFTDLLSLRLEHLGARVLRHQSLPPNDGSIAFGQAAVAAARMKHGMYNQ